ncbi:30S ribosomal protein S4 [archaeon]|nr:30S ribosomal protein S4 [archaeon]|tara:strand:- start:105 stop:731 length:627 start_codon:yes stop_codon:yes gene_type:complete
MGQPKQQTKTYARPLRPYSKDRLLEERTLMDRYGLRRKKELWRAQEFIRNSRSRAMQLLASESPLLKKEMMGKLYKFGIVDSDAEIDDILGLTVDKLLNRRLQSIVHSKGLATTIKHARQVIVHRLIEVDGRKIQQPSFLVSREIEDKIKLVQKKKKVKEAPKEEVKEEPKKEEVKEEPKAEAKPQEKEAPKEEVKEAPKEEKKEEKK